MESEIVERDLILFSNRKIYVQFNATTTTPNAAAAVSYW